MVIQPWIILSLIGALTMFCFLVGYLYYLYQKEVESKEKEGAEYRQAQEVTKEAYLKAKDILDKTIERSKYILLDSEYLKRDIQKDMDDALRRMVESNVKLFNEDSDSFLKDYKSAIGDLRSRYLRETEDVLKKISASTELEIEDFRKSLKQDTLDTQGFIGKKIEGEFEKIRNDLEEYKKKRMEGIATSINTIIVKISEEVLGKSITLSEHESLVINALEEAKKEGVFNS